MKYKYDLVRSNRKSISVLISSDNKITVRCPWNMRVEAVEKFLDDKSAWIEKTVLLNSLKLAANDDVLEYRKIYLAGEKLPLIIGDRNAVSEDGIFVKNIDSVSKLYKKSFSEQFFERVSELSVSTRLTPTSVAVRDYKGRWGCCDAKNNLVFNYKVFMLPPTLADYVIVHELCHTLCHNHSPAFWLLVGEIIPDYKDRRKQLKNFDFITSLY